jgi:hypothetical protein
MPMPKILISSINSVQTGKKWTDLDVVGRKVLLILKEKLLLSGIGTTLQRYDMS